MGGATGESKQGLETGVVTLKQDSGKNRESLTELLPISWPLTTTRSGAWEAGEGMDGSRKMNVELETGDYGDEE